MKVDIFIPCIVDQLFPKTAFNMVKVLEKFGCDVHYNSKQTCCGLPAFNNGFQQEAKTVGKKFLKDFSSVEHYIIAPTGTCLGYIRNDYPQLFENSSEHNSVKKVKMHLFEFSEFLVNVLHVTDVGATLNAKATYHDGCCTLRECGIKSQPRQLLHNVNGLELVEMTEAETCCGFGGTFATNFEAISIGMTQTKIQSALETGAEYIITTDASCILQLNSYLKKHKIKMKAVHLADVLAHGW